MEGAIWGFSRIGFTKEFTYGSSALKGKAIHGVHSKATTYFMNLIW